MDKNEKTVSELLREAARGFDGDTGFVMSNARKLFGVRTHIYTDLFYAIADRSDAELEAARSFASVKFLDEVISINDWPERKPDEGIEGYICRCFLPRPLFEDGDPVQVSDIDEIGALANCCVFMDGSWHFDPDKYEDEANPKPWDEQRGAMDERIKRPAKVLDADGVEIRVGDTVYETHRGEALTVYEVNSQYVHAKTENGAVRGNLTASYLTHQKPVFDADGVRICVGDTVFPMNECSRGKVNSVEGSTVNVAWEDLGDCHELPEKLTHKEPDSQEHIDEDAELNAPAYCKKYGLTPHEASAGKSTKYKHLFKRQRALMERGAL